MRGIVTIALVGTGLIVGAVALAPLSRSHAQTAASDDSARSRADQRAAALDRQSQIAARAAERALLAATALAARVQQAEAAVAASERELAAVRGQRRALDARLARERAPVAQLMAGLQTLVRRPPLLTLVQPGSVEDAVHLRAVVAAVQPQIEARTAALRNSLEQARALEAQAARIAARGLAQRADLVARRRELSALSATERLKAQRAASAADREAERAFAIAEQARDLPTLVRRVVPRSGAGAGAPSLPSYRLPVTGAMTAAGSAPADGVTLAPRPSAQAVAPAAGRIAFAGPYRGYGAIVIVEHPGGWTSLVTGLASAQVAVGQAVIAGSPIGQAPARNPRIGLELRRDGRRVDPLDQVR